MTITKIPLEELIGRAEEADVAEGLTRYDPTYDDTDYAAEREAENGWLRHAESLGWEEALLDSYVESGFISRY